MVWTAGAARRCWCLCRLPCTAGRFYSSVPPTRGKNSRKNPLLIALIGFGRFGGLTFDLYITNFVINLRAVHLDKIYSSFKPPKVTTLKGTEVMKSILYVGDNSCMNLKVSLWKDNACHEVSAGDIIFLQNMKIAKFRGRIEVNSAQFSKVFVLLKRCHLLSSQGLENAMKACQQGPLVKEKLNLVIHWARQTQGVLVSFLNRVSDDGILQDRQHDHIANAKTYKDFCLKEDTVCPSVLGVLRKCPSVADLACIEAPCIVEFRAKIEEIYLPCPANTLGLCLGVQDCILFSTHLHGNSAQEILRQLLCIGCETCGCPLEPDHNGVYAACDCGLLRFGASNAKRRKGQQIKRIFRPFMLRVGDPSGQTALVVTHLAAVHMFANITAEQVFESLHGNCTSDAFKKRKQCMNDSTGDIHLSAENFSQGRLNYSSILIFLMRSLLSSKNSQFGFRAKCCDNTIKGLLDNMKCMLNLISLSLPTISESMK